MRSTPLHRLACLGTALALLGFLGCNTPQTTTRRSSLMDYLYPKQQAAPAPNPAGARLRLPLKLGIAFVPGGSANWRVQNLMAPGQEKPLLEVILDHTQGNQTRAAEILGMNRNTLRKKLQQYGLIEGT